MKKIFLALLLAIGSIEIGFSAESPIPTGNQTPVKFTDPFGVPVYPGNPASNSLNVNITGGAGSGGTSQTDNTGLSADTPMGALYDNTPPTITDGNVGVPRMDVNRQLMVNCTTGCAGAAGDATATGALGSNGATVVISLSTYNGAALNFTSGGTLSGTVVAEGSNDGGGTYPFAVVLANPTSGAIGDAGCDRRADRQDSQRV